MDIIVIGITKTSRKESTGRGTRVNGRMQVILNGPVPIFSVTPTSQRLDLAELKNSTDIDAYKLRDAAGAARRACALAKLKWERVESLRYRADLAEAVKQRRIRKLKPRMR